MVDGVEHRLDAGEPLRLVPGQSVTITRNLWHRFYGEAGKGTVFVGEVSQVNDDLTDNYFSKSSAGSPGSRRTSRSFSRSGMRWRAGLRRSFTRARA